LRCRLLIAAAFIAAVSFAAPPPTVVVDDLGRRVELSTPIRRVVTLAPNLTEMVYALGGQRLLVGTDDFSDFPTEAKRLRKVGGMQPNVELIAALSPDLVLATRNGNHASLAPALASAHVAMFVAACERLAEIPQALQKVARILALPTGDAAASSLRRAIEQQRRRRLHPPTILFALWASPMYVAGRETFLDDLINLTGAANAVPAGMHGWPAFSLEAFAAHPPDILLYPAASVSRPQIDAVLVRVPQWKGMVVAVDENRFTRPGPRVALAAADLNAILDRWKKSP
jgi:iron complex transport system substrate-binding protein